jgi:hypothetical protein
MFLWFASFLMFHISGAILHTVLLLAVISLIVHFFTGKRQPAKAPVAGD